MSGPPSSARAIEFLSETLALWEVAGEVAAGSGKTLAVIRACGKRVAIERAEPGAPFRWQVCTHEADADADAVSVSPRRPCASWVGVLAALRRAFGVERGTPLRVVAAPGS